MDWFGKRLRIGYREKDRTNLKEAEIIYKVHIYALLIPFIVLSRTFLINNSINDTNKRLSKNHIFKIPRFVSIISFSSEHQPNGTRHNKKSGEQQQCDRRKRLEGC